MARLHAMQSTLLSERDSLRREKASAAAECSRAVAEVAALREKLSAAEQSAAALGDAKRRFEAASTSLTGLRTKHAALVKAHNDLRAEVAILGATQGGGGGEEELRALRGENDRLKGELFEGGMLQELEELKWQAAQGQAKADAFVAYLRLCPPAPDNFSALALAGVALG